LTFCQRSFIHFALRSLSFQHHATLAQLVEQLIRNEQVVGSTPMGGSRKALVFARAFSLRATPSTELVAWRVRIGSAGVRAKAPCVLLRLLAIALLPLWLRFVEAIDGRLVSAWDQVPVDINGNLDGVMTHLVLYVRQGLPLLNEERSEGMTQVVDTDVSKPAFRE
jgi:hypothetical protein